MTILLETLDEHALSVDFSMFILIWMVQVIVYPTFHKINNNEFIDWHRKYCNGIGFFVLPVMSFQLLETASSCFFSVGNLIWFKLVSVLGTWLITFLVSAPCHRKLQVGKDHQVIDRLIRTNWWRTLLWSITFTISIFVHYL